MYVFVLKTAVKGFGLDAKYVSIVKSQQPTLFLNA